MPTPFYRFDKNKMKIICIAALRSLSLTCVLLNKHFFAIAKKPLHAYTALRFLPSLHALSLRYHYRLHRPASLCASHCALPRPALFRACLRLRRAFAAFAPCACLSIRSARSCVPFRRSLACSSVPFVYHRTPTLNNCAPSHVRRSNHSSTLLGGPYPLKKLIHIWQKTKLPFLFLFPFSTHS